MEKIRTNHIKVNFLWDKFLEDFDLYKIEYSMPMTLATT